MENKKNRSGSINQHMEPYEKEQQDNKKRLLIYCATNLLCALLLGLVIVVLIVLIPSSFVIQRNDLIVDDDEFYNTVTIQNLMGHLENFARIAKQFNNSRSINNGYNASATYVKSRLQSAGYSVKEQYFTIREINFIDPSFSQTAPEESAFVLGTDYNILSYSASANIDEVPVSAITGFGCDEADFGEFPEGNAVLIPYGGSCSLNARTLNAQKGGASAAIFVNDITKSTPVKGKLEEFTTTTIPAMGITFLLGNQLSSEGAEVSISWVSKEILSYTMNILADTSDGDANRVIVVGSHLDSVPAGPGINDNGSGSSVNLEIALQWKEQGIKAKNKVRFAWWSGEELGLLGSTHYVTSLSPSEQKTIALNLNYDMLGSPNFMRGVYNGYEADTPILAQSSKIASVYEGFFNMKKLPYVLTEFNGRSDYGPFLEANIPAGGLKTGSDGIKTLNERTLFGGFAEATFDPCYHQSCDTIENVNREILAENAQAAAYTLEVLATQSDLDTFLGVPN